MARLAFLSPLPPAPTGIADYSAEVLAAWAARHEVTAFAAQDDVDRAALPAGVELAGAGSFVDAHAARPFDLAVYQLGNATAHAWMYPLMAAVPGLVVLHDLVLHHARARAFLDGPEVRAYAREPWRADRQAEAARALQGYRAMVAVEEPDRADRIVEAQLGTIGDLLPYAYPLVRDVIEPARAVAVHNTAMEAAVAGMCPRTPVGQVVMPAARVTVPADDVLRTRRALGLAEGDFVVACLGLVTREKRIETVARAVARVEAAIPGIRLLLVGAVADREWLDGVLARAGIRGRTVVTGRVPMATLPAHLESADVVAHLRWPTARETSAALLRALAQGRAVVMSDLDNFAEIPADAVLRADVADEEGELTRALLRLAERPALREALGRRAAAHVATHHAAARVADSYDAALALALRP